MGRGVITPEIVAKAKELLGDDNFTKADLRLLPYVQFVAINSKKLDKSKINRAEQQILQKWEDMGLLELSDWVSLLPTETGRLRKLTITKKFWDASCEILWLGYANG